MPTAETLLGVMASLLLLGGIIKMFTRKPAIEAEFATKHEVRVLEEKLDAHITRMDERLGERLDALDAKRSRQVAGLHDDIRSVDQKVERLIGRLEAMK